MKAAHPPGAPEPPHGPTHVTLHPVGQQFASSFRIVWLPRKAIRWRRGPARPEPSRFSAVSAPCPHARLTCGYPRFPGTASGNYPRRGTVCVTFQEGAGRRGHGHSGGRRRAAYHCGRRRPGLRTPPPALPGGHPGGHVVATITLQRAAPAASGSGPSVILPCAVNSPGAAAGAAPADDTCDSGIMSLSSPIGVFDKSHNHLASSARYLVVEASYSL
jgi:hypothetical protein